MTQTDRTTLICASAQSLAGDRFKVRKSDLDRAKRRRGRRRAPPAVQLAQDVALYLAHTFASVRVADAAVYFGRSTRAAYEAVSRVEDKRENGAFDKLVTGLEKKLEKKVFG